MTITHGGNLFEICRARGWNWREVLDLSESINPLGPAPGVRTAIVEALDRIAHYPEKTPRRLVERLAALWEIEPEQILVGNGATELLHFLARTWPQDQVTLLLPTFTEFHRAYPQAACAPNCDLNSWPEEGLLVLTQPNNPTGQAAPFELLRQRITATNQPVVIDESFIEFSGLPSMVKLAARRPNLVVLRSLTKFYALPGVRIGALVADAGTISKLSERREPWQVSVLAEAAALAALADVDHAERSRICVAQERPWFWSQLTKLPGISPVPSCANFFLLYLQTTADEMCRWFLERKVILRNCTGWPGIGGEAVRFAVRTRPENERIVTMLEEYLCEN